MKVLTYYKGCLQEEIMTKKLRDDIVALGHEKCYEVKDADVIIYITCAGTGDAIKEAIEELQIFLGIKKKETPLIITGCLTQIREFNQAFGVFDDVKIVKNRDFVIPILNFINGDNKHNSLKTRLENRTRIFFNNITDIQFFLCEGCLNTCSFCKTNYLNRPLKSIPYEIVLKHLQDMIKKGTKCITLSGDNTALYGVDLYGKPMLNRLIHELCETPGLMYLTVNEIAPQNMYPELLHELVSNKKVVSVGIQLESADNRILNLMHRNHTIEQFDAIVTPLKQAGKFVGTVLLSGFPTEKYEDIDYTINYMKDRKIATELICIYSDFDLIPSHNLEQLSKREKNRHAIYLLNGVKVSNRLALEEKIDDTEDAVVYGKEDNIIYLKKFHYGYSLRKEHQDLDVGSVMPTKAKSIVKEKTSKHRCIYKY